MNGGESLDVSGSGAEPLEGEDPRRIGTIPLLGKLGSGGMGRVYLGVVDGRYAAVKQVLPHFAADENFLRHFGHELDNLARLPNEISAPLLASDRQARPPWFATAYIPGLTLTEAMALHGGPLPVQALWLLLREAAAGLRAVHALDMVHRDLKPSNVMLTQDGATLIDFGVARAADQSRLTRTGVVVGTPAYMSPEQASASKELTGATDVFALGALLAFAAVGRPPFGEGSGVDVLYRIVHGEPDLDGLRALDQDLAEVVEACLDKNPLGRPTADRLFLLAEQRAVPARPGWPALVMDRLAGRAAFAARTAPQVVLEPEPASPEEAEPVVVGRNAPITAAERPRRRTRLLLAVVPIVLVAGTTIGVQLLPKLTAPRAAESGPPASGPAGTGPAASASSGSPSAGTSPSGVPSASGPPSAAPSPGSVAGVPAASGGGGAGGANGTGNNGPGNTGSGNNGSGNTGTGSAGSTGGPGNTAGPSTKPTAAPPPATTPSGGSRYYVLKNGTNGSCVAVNQFGNALTLGSCTGNAALWSSKTVPGGGFQIVNKGTGQCLQAGMFNNASTIGDCSQSGLKSWYSGSHSSLADQYDGKCLDLAFGGGATTAQCSGSASQQWKRQ